ncbi:uncharacterized protein LOC108160350 isoform X2 [Drosophila miranda]|uniref:uncharacterized protein LOC108160350 isoform X2 n=1 Tax=Drosophila miranda TaxID=7229 RepID=UPI00143F6220|nr:uncharacterized protein LOC108160350 isoform X2 [Drosophila miranda]
MSMRRMGLLHGLLRDKPCPLTMAQSQQQNYCKNSGEDICKLKKQLEEATQRRKEAEAAAEAEREAAMIKNRVDKCIVEKTRAFKECVEGSADKQQQDILRIMMGCLKTGIRQICANSVISAFCRAKAEAGANKIRQMLKQCGEKFPKGAGSNREPTAVDLIQKKCRGMAENKKLQAPGGNQAERSRYAKKVDQCVASEWKDLCSSRSSLSEKEQVELDSMQQCVCDQIKEKCRKQVLREMCVDGGQQPRKKANSQVLSVKARPKEVAEEVPEEKPSPPPKESLNPEVEKCVEAKLQSVEGFVRSLSDDEGTARENISECARIKLREQCEAEIQQRKLEEEIQRKKCLEKKARREAEMQQRKLSEEKARKEAEARRAKCLKNRARKEAEMQQRKLSEEKARKEGEARREKCLENRTREAKAKDDKCQPGGPGGGTEAVVNQELLKHFRECLFKTLGGPHDTQPGRKVTIAGAGAVGMACAMALLCKGVTNHVALFDDQKDWVAAERLDMLHGSMFINNPRIEQCNGVAATKDSRLVVLTAGNRPKPNETRLDVAQKTADIVKAVMPALLEQSPRATFIVVSNHADVMAWVARKVTNLPYERCFSTGCHLDTARFRLFIGQLLGIAARSVHGYVIGEHGGSSVPLWSTVSVGGVRLQEILPVIGTESDPMYWSAVHKDVVEAAFRVIAVKGYTNWAIGLTVADVVSAIFEDSHRVLTLSTNVQGFCGVKDEVFMSVPCVVSGHGISAICRPKLSDWEKKRFLKSAQTLLEAQCSIKV